MTKISIIIPIYNNENYLNDCIKSVLDQSYSNIELILINNGSSDSSLEIINSFAKKDDRVRPLMLPHTSTGTAKNYGVSMATGDFICFVHPTDILGKGNINNLVNSQDKYNSDIACSTYYKVDNNGIFYFFDNDPTPQKIEGVFTPQEWSKREDGISANITDLFIQDFNKLIRRSLFKNVMFPDIDQCEDNFTIWKLYLLADNISYINVGDYGYRIIDTNDNSQKKFERCLYEVKSLEERMAIYNLIDFDSSFLNNKYVNALKTLKENALLAGNYHYYKDCCFKLDMIKKYTTK